MGGSVIVIQVTGFYQGAIPPSFVSGLVCSILIKLYHLLTNKSLL
jgi:hypothetical protein